jgi:N-acetylglucosaminyldiphosphoundecaprenol N-acetyl-beta-D-mannosaminyltransferase
MNVAGLPVAKTDGAQVLDWLWDDALTHRHRVYALLNGQSATLRRRPAYNAVLRSTATVPVADGAALVFGARFTGQGPIGRYPGPDLMEVSAERAASDGTSFFLLGGAPGVADALAGALVARHPGLRIAGASTPPFGAWSDGESLAMCAAIRESRADIVWLGVSAPKQEIWAHRWREEIGRPIVCVGAAFDFLSGNKPRAPRWMRAIGMEWLFRLVSEPRRVWKRYLVGNIVFLWDLLRFGRRPAH